MTNYLLHKTLFLPFVPYVPSKNLGIVVVIPCYDEDNLLLTLKALKNCDLPDSDVEVLVIINDSEHTNKIIQQKNLDILDQVLTWSEQNNSSRFRFYAHYEKGLPAKSAGVGLARKIGMDEACWRLEKANNPAGIIACFDADSLCDKNYLKAIEQYFSKHSKCPACSIYFEHPTSGDDFDPSIYKAIIDYELHLRYYIHAQKFAGFPFAFQTIGSSMAVRCSAYQKQGGMNKRKAGEDFYFIHKFTASPHFAEIRNTRVIPSPRPSHRVPFGTGKAVGSIIDDGRALMTYHPDIFVEMKSLISALKGGYQKDRLFILSKVSELNRSFLNSFDFPRKLDEFNSNSSSEITFYKRLFQWFNAFMVMKYVHFLRDNAFENVDVGWAAKTLLQRVSTNQPFSNANNLDLLEIFRGKDREEGSLEGRR